MVRSQFSRLFITIFDTFNFLKIFIRNLKFHLICTVVHCYYFFIIFLLLYIRVLLSHKNFNTRRKEIIFITFNFVVNL